MGPSAHSSSTKRWAKSLTLHLFLPLGGSEQASAIRCASCTPSSFLGLVFLGLRCTRAACRPSRAKRVRTRITVERLTSKASAIITSVQEEEEEEASPGARPSPSSALRRMRAWANWRGGAWPRAIKPSRVSRSSALNLTGFFLLLGTDRPPRVRRRKQDTPEGVLFQTNRVRALDACCVV